MNGDEDDQPRFLSHDELVREARDQHEQFHMRHEAWLTSIQRLFDDLDADQLQTLRTIITNTQASSFYDGQIYQILRLKHRIDPDTGRPLVTEETLLEQDSPG